MMYIWQKLLPYKALQTAPKYYELREQKRRHPPLQLTPPIVQGHLGVRLIADINTINLTEAIFEFPFSTRDMEGERVIFDPFPRCCKCPKMTLWSWISQVWGGNSKIASARLIVLGWATSRAYLCLWTPNGMGCRGGCRRFCSLNTY